jgi:hypothetical protein
MLTEMSLTSLRSPLMRGALLLIIAGSLTACTKDTRRSIGLERTPPDAFSVVTRAPLEVPPDFGLRPPQPGAERPNEPTVREQARAALFGGTARTPSQEFGDRSPGEAALLKQAGAADADPSIRGKVDHDSLQLASESSGFADTLIFWRDPPPPGDPVDADAETKRLRANAALGKPAAEGDTPVIQRRSSTGFLGSLF